MKKRFLTFLFPIAALLLLAGCAGAPAEETPAAAPEAAAAVQEAADPAPEAAAAVQEAADPAPEAPSEDPAAPAGDYSGIRFTSADLSGNEITESYLRGNKLTVINFWATWCPPCVGEIPEFSKVAEDYAGQGVGFLGVQLDEDMDAANTLWSKSGISYPTVLPDGDLVDIGNSLSAIPVTMLFDSNGQPVGRPQVGSIFASDLEAMIDDALAAQ